MTEQEIKDFETVRELNAQISYYQDLRDNLIADMITKYNYNSFQELNNAYLKLKLTEGIA